MPKQRSLARRTTSLIPGWPSARPKGKALKLSLHEKQTTETSGGKMPNSFLPPNFTAESKLTINPTEFLEKFQGAWESNILFFEKELKNLRKQYAALDQACTDSSIGSLGVEGEMETLTTRLSELLEKNTRRLQILPTALKTLKKQMSQIKKETVLKPSLMLPWFSTMVNLVKSKMKNMTKEEQNIQIELFHLIMIIYLRLKNHLNKIYTLPSTSSLTALTKVMETDVFTEIYTMHELHLSMSLSYLHNSTQFSWQAKILLEMGVENITHPKLFSVRQLIQNAITVILKQASVNPNIQNIEDYFSSEMIKPVFSNLAETLTKKLYIEIPEKCTRVLQAAWLAFLFKESAQETAYYNKLANMLYNELDDNEFRGNEKAKLPIIEVLIDNKKRRLYTPAPPLRHRARKGLNLTNPRKTVEDACELYEKRARPFFEALLASKASSLETLPIEEIRQLFAEIKQTSGETLEPAYSQTQILSDATKSLSPLVYCQTVLPIFLDFFAKPAYQNPKFLHKILQIYLKLNKSLPNLKPSTLALQTNDHYITALLAHLAFKAGNSFNDWRLDKYLAVESIHLLVKLSIEKRPILTDQSTRNKAKTLIALYLSIHQAYSSDFILYNPNLYDSELENDFSRYKMGSIFGHKNLFSLIWRFLAFMHIDDLDKYNYYLLNAERLIKHNYLYQNQIDTLKEYTLNIEIGHITFPLDPHQDLPPREELLDALGIAHTTSDSVVPKFMASALGSVKKTFLSTEDEKRKEEQRRERINTLMQNPTHCITDNNHRQELRTLLDNSYKLNPSYLEVNFKASLLLYALKNNPNFNPEINQSIYACLFLSVLYEMNSGDLLKMEDNSTLQENLIRNSDFAKNCFKAALHFNKNICYQGPPMMLAGVPLSLEKGKPTTPDQIIEAYKLEQAELLENKSAKPTSPPLSAPPLEEQLETIDTPTQTANFNPLASLKETLKTAVNTYQSQKKSFLLHGKAGKNRMNLLFTKIDEANDIKALSSTLRDHLKRQEAYIKVCGFFFGGHKGQLRDKSGDTAILEAIKNNPALCEHLKLGDDFLLGNKKERKTARKTLCKQLRAF